MLKQKKATCFLFQLVLRNLNITTFYKKTLFCFYKLYDILFQVIDADFTGVLWWIILNHI